MSGLGTRKQESQITLIGQHSNLIKPAFEDLTWLAWPKKLALST
jgi:hypothetical protein